MGVGPRRGARGRRNSSAHLNLISFSPFRPVTLAAAFLGLLLVTSEIGEFRHPGIEQTVREKRERERERESVPSNLNLLSPRRAS